MKEELVNILLFLVCLSVLCILQAIFINGVKASMEEGMIFEKVGKWVTRLGSWGKALGGCIRCMSSVFGAATYWPTIVYAFGFQTWEIPLFVADVFILVSLTWWFYKKL